METKRPSVRVRWFNDACYELALPNGRNILIDPYIDSSPLKVLGSEALERVDYVLISHTHFDHILDLDIIRRRFAPQVYVGHLSAVALADYFDLPGCQINLCYPNETYLLGDARLTCLRGKHTSLGEMDRPSRWPQNLADEHLPPALEELMKLGSYEYTNFLLELPEGWRFLIWGGGATPDAVFKVRGLRPDFSIIQLPREPVEEVAALYAAAGGQVILPHHHDSFLAKGPAREAVIRDTVAATRRLAPHTTVLLPEKGRWYSLPLDGGGA